MKKINMIECAEVTGGSFDGVVTSTSLMPLTETPTGMTAFIMIDEEFTFIYMATVGESL